MPPSPSSRRKRVPDMPKKKLSPEEKRRAREARDRVFYRRAHRALAGFFRVFLRVHATGVENLPEAGGCLVCSNHISAMDAIAIAAVCPRQIRFLAKKELFRVPLIGWFIRRLGAFSVDRGASDVAAIKKIIAVAEEGEVVSIFPQGHRYAGMNPADTPIKSGAGMVALRAGCPVLPVAVKTKRQRYTLFRRVELVFGTPIPVADLCDAELSGKEAYAAASATIFREICTLGGWEASQKEAQA